MQIGMLWFDNSKDTLSDKILKATTYYSRKYGHRANCCWVSNSTPEILDGNIVLDSVTVIGSQSVLPNHFWIGVEKDEQ